MARRRKLPRLRWLLAGGLAAGIWVVMQEREGPRPPERVGQATSLVALPRTVVRPPRRPAAMTTSSIVRPQEPVGEALRTISRVRMRADSTTSSSVVTWLEAGQAVRVLARSGKWRRVSASGRTGWVHGDYLGRAASQAPRPKLPVAAVSMSGGKHPSRAPQGGDCQCPYDLMLDGSACGERSAYAMRGAAAALCYR